MKKLLLFFLTTSIISCGDRAEQAPPEGTFNMPQPGTDTNVEQPLEVLFHVRAIGNTMENIDFDPKEFSVPAGATVKVRLVNESQGAGMEHNIVFVALGKGETIAPLGWEAGKEKSYVPDHSDVIAYSEVIDPGETTEFEFMAPQAGSYHYICTYPGHYPKMIGRLYVTEAIQ